MGKTMAEEGGGDLVARSATTTPPASKADMSLAGELERLSLKAQEAKGGAKTAAAKPSGGPLDTASPADFFNLHRLRTSALAHKTKTTSNFGGRHPDLYNELCGLSLSARKDPSQDSGTEEGEEEAKREAKEEAVEEDGAMIPRGPVQPASRTARIPANYPYAGAGKRGPKPLVAGACVVGSPAEFWQAQQRRALPSALPTMVPLASCDVPAYYPSCDGPPSLPGPPALPHPTDAPSSPIRTKRTAMPSSPFADGLVSTDELSRILDAPTELPDDLSDFILKYSRRYSTDSPGLGPEELRSLSRKSSSSDSSASSSPKHRPLSLSDEAVNCDSPISAGSAPQPSPAQPKGAQSPGTPSDKASAPALKALLPKCLTPPSSARKGKARDRLRACFGEKENEVACLWAVKCIQSCPGALYYRDPDGDSLLHIVVWHKDLPKVYSLVELMRKTEFSACQAPFDLPNRLHETPLLLAVEKRCEEVVSYLLEVGANPNFQTRKAEADAPLHYAAARGMTEIVELLAAHPATDRNLRNGLGLTPLLCAVKNHGVIEEDSQCLVNNKPAIRALLRAQADPKVPDAQSGKTVVHYAVERMDPELVEIYRGNLEAGVMGQVANAPSFAGETPMELLQRISAASPAPLPAEDALRSKMLLTLLSAGAHPVAEPNPDLPLH